MKKLLVCVPLSFLVGCVSSGGMNKGKNAHITALADQKIAEYIELDQAERQRHMNNSNYDATQGEWINTQKANCKIFIKNTVEPNAKAYWDGECKSGYAYGLGREFIITDNYILEAISEYKKPKEQATQYYYANNQTKMFVIGLSSVASSLEPKLLHIGQVDNENIFFEGMAFADYTNKEMLNILKSKEFNYINSTYKSIGGLEVLSYQDTDDQLYKGRYAIKFRGQDVGVQFKYLDGGNDFYYKNGKQIVLIDTPNSIMEFLDQKMSLLDNINKNDKINSDYALAEAKTKKYISGACASRVSKIKEIDDDQYLAICTKYKSLNVFSNQMKDALQANMDNKQRLLNESFERAEKLKHAEMFGESNGANSSGWVEGLKLAALVVTAVASGLSQPLNNQNTMTAYTPSIQPQMPTRLNSSLGTTNQRSQSYQSSYGNNYKYDLSNQSDRLRYSTDTEAQINDKIRVNPTAIMEQRKGEYGGGYLD